jgi:choline dehydrogenase-like flavoprotein
MADSDHDFIVIGGGTAGLVVASRLTENPNVNVLVLEAGGDHLADPRVNIPAMWAAALGSELDWKYTTIAQVSVHGLESQSVADLLVVRTI